MMNFKKDNTINYTNGSNESNKSALYKNTNTYNNKSNNSTLGKNTNTDNNKFNNTNNYISEQDALDIALKDVGLTQNDIYDLDIELEYKYSQTVYEINFDYQRHEYEYYINAESGTIVKSFRERD